MGWKIYDLMLQVFLRSLFGPAKGAFDPGCFLSVFV